MERQCLAPNVIGTQGVTAKDQSLYSADKLAMVENIWKDGSFEAHLSALNAVNMDIGLILVMLLIWTPQNLVDMIPLSHLPLRWDPTNR